MSTTLHFEQVGPPGGQRPRTAILEIPDGSSPPEMIEIDGLAFRRVPEPINEHSVRKRCLEIEKLEGVDDEQASYEVMRLFADLTAYTIRDDTGIDTIKRYFRAVADQLPEWLDDWRSK